MRIPAPSASTDGVVVEVVSSLLLVWDHAGWHSSQEVPAWLCEHDRRGKRRAAEAGNLLTARACAAPGWAYEEHLTLSAKVA